MFLLRYLIIILFISFTSLTWAESSRVKATGDILQIAVPGVAFAATLYLEDTDGRNQFLKSFGANLSTTHLLKNVVGKKRPDGSDTRAFPSGHTSAAFQGASFIHFRYGLRYAMPAYLAASFVGYSRINARKHDYVDVIAGAALGTLSSWLFTQPFAQQMNGVALTPVVGENSFGLAFSKRW